MLTEKYREKTLKRLGVFILSYEDREKEREQKIICSLNSAQMA